MKGGFTHGERRSPKPEGAVAEGAGVGFDVSLLSLHLAAGAPCPSSIASRNSSSILGSGRE